MTGSLVSIIVPAYNYGHFLAATLQNITAQVYDNWECIIVDDGSMDDTASVARVFTEQDKRFRYVHQQNQGLSAARNTGIRQSSGAYIQFLDADDLLHEHKLEIQLAYLEGHQDADIVYGDFLYFHTDRQGDKLKGRGSEEHTEKHLLGSACGIEMAKRFCINNFIPVSAPLVRRSIIDKTGFFDTEYRSYEDWHYWFRCCLQGACFAYAPQQGTETYIRFGHASMMGNKKKMVANGIRIRKFMGSYLKGSLKRYNSYRLLKLQLRALLGI